MDNSSIITIGRQLGSGGREIGQKLATLMGFAFYDKELIRLASKKSGVKEEFFEKVDEKRRFSFLTGFSGLRNPLTEDSFPDFYLSNESLFRIQSEVIRSLADEGSSVFVGRCADYVLKEYPRCLNIFITADTDDRIRRISALQTISPGEAEEVIARTDRKRSDYYNYFSGKVWGAAESYHLCINSSMLGLDETVSFISILAQKKFGFKTH